MQRSIFLFGSGTIEIEIGFMDITGSLSTVVRPPISGSYPHSAFAGLVLRGSALQPEGPSSKQGKKSADTDDKGKKGKDEAMGSALRHVYHSAVNEPVPDEMLDLLNKLG